jgi:hypothetical protein
MSGISSPVLFNDLSLVLEKSALARLELCVSDNTVLVYGAVHKKKDAGRLFRCLKDFFLLFNATELDD